MKVPAEPEPSTYRIEKAKTDAVLTLAHGEVVRGYFFVAHQSARSPGQELVSEILNGESGFFPFEVHGAGGASTALFNRRHVMTVALAENEASREPGYEVAPERVVSILLATGDRIEGTIRVHRPVGRDRLSDWARQSDVFRYLETETATLLINIAHVVEVKEAPRRD